MDLIFDMEASNQVSLTRNDKELLIIFEHQYRSYK